MTDEEFEKIWADLKARDAKQEAEWEALPEEEKERYRKKFDDGFYDRISENPFGDDDEDNEDD